MSANKLRLYNLLRSCIQIDNAPDTVDVNFVVDRLLDNGYVVFCQHQNDVYALLGALSGVSVYSQPTNYKIANPVIQSTHDYTVGVDCMPIYATRRRQQGIGDIKTIINEYAARLDKIDVSIDRAIINTRQVRTYVANTPQTYESIKQIVDTEQNADKSATVVQSDIVSDVQAHFIDVKNQYVLDMLLRDKRAILSDFLIQFGIDVLPYEKKERMITDEIDSNSDEAVIERNGWSGWIDEQLQAVNTVLGTNMSCSYVPTINIPSITDTTDNTDNNGGDNNVGQSVD